MSSMDDKPFPRAALLGAGLLILSTVAGVGTIQLQKYHAGTLRAASTTSRKPGANRSMVAVTASA